jgi:hypothetical protein
MASDATPIDSPTTSSARIAHDHGPHSTRAMWAMMLGCCLAIPLALIVGGVSAGGLAGARPWLLAIAGALAIALVIAHRASRGPHCESAGAEASPQR